MHPFMRRPSKGLAAVGVTALVLASLSVGSGAWAAEAGKPAAKEKAARTDRRGEAKGGSTKASGAGIVAKAQACFGVAPQIEKVKPDEGKAGDKVTITGRSFGAKGCLTTVSFGPGHPAKFEHVNETTVTATVPAVKQKGLRLLTVTTASGEDSKPFLVK